MQASQRPDDNVLPLPGSLRGGAQAKVIGTLLSSSLIAEKVIEGAQQADSALDTVWRNDEDGRAVLLYITLAGLEATSSQMQLRSRRRRAAPESHGAAERGSEAGSAEAGHDRAEAGDAPDAARTAAQAGGTAPKVRAANSRSNRSSLPGSNAQTLPRRG